MLTTIDPPESPVLPTWDAALRTVLALEASDDERDALIESLIAAATGMVEAYTRRRLMTQTVRLTLDGFGDGCRRATRLPIAPVQSVAQVQYLDAAGDWMTVPQADFRLVSSMQPPELWPVSGSTWPVPMREPAVVRIDLVVGYGASASDVPSDLLHAVRMGVVHLDSFHGPVSLGQAPHEIPFGMRTCMDAHVLWL